MSNARMTRVHLGDRELVDVLTRNQANELIRVRTRGAKKLGRNDPCFCGSGRKLKRCHYNQLRTIARR